MTWWYDYRIDYETTTTTTTEWYGVDYDVHVIDFSITRGWHDVAMVPLSTCFHTASLFPCIINPTSPSHLSNKQAS